ncbi:MAG TPA: helix-hairpin-helix domain-containing protein [Polyangiaceae bacterium]
MKPTLVPVMPGFVARVRGFIGRPLGRGVLAIGGLVVLSLVGRFAAAGGRVSPAAVGSISAAVSVSAPASVAVAAAVPESVTAADAAPPSHAARATADDPVYLNDASVDDLRRLPGIGQKRALAVLELRRRLGRFRQIEDLLRVRGIGRSTLRKLRPLVRLDHAGDGGVA